MFDAARCAAQIFRARESLLAARVQAITFRCDVRRAAADAIARGQRRILRADVDVESRFFGRRNERHAHARVAARVVLHERERLASIVAHLNLQSRFGLLDADFRGLASAQRNAEHRVLVGRESAFAGSRNG